MAAMQVMLESKQAEWRSRSTLGRARQHDDEPRDRAQGAAALTRDETTPAQIYGQWRLGACFQGLVKLELNAQR